MDFFVCGHYLRKLTIQGSSYALTCVGQIKVGAIGAASHWFRIEWMLMALRQSDFEMRILCENHDWITSPYLCLCCLVRLRFGSVYLSPRSPPTGPEGPQQPPPEAHYYITQKYIMSKLALPQKRPGQQSSGNPSNNLACPHAWLQWH